MFSLISVFCFCSLCSPRFVPFFCSPCFLWGADDNTAVFLYMNSCTLKTIQLLMNLHLCGLVFSFSVVLQSLTNVCSFLKCLFASPSFFYFLFPVSSQANADRYGPLFLPLVAAVAPRARVLLLHTHTPAARSLGQPWMATRLLNYLTVKSV